MQEKDTFILPNVQGNFYVKTHGSKNSLPFPIFIFFTYICINVESTTNKGPYRF